MAPERLARPEANPVRAGRVSAAPSKAKRTAKKRAGKPRVTSPAVKKPSKSIAALKSASRVRLGTRKAYKQNAEKVRAAVEKAKATKAANLICGDKSELIADPGDEAANTAIAKDKSRWDKAATLANVANRHDESVIGEDAETSGAAPREKLEPKPSARVKRTAVDRLDDPPPATGVALIERVTQAVERELSQIEIIVGGNRVKPQQRTEAERRARTLASLARTLTEVRKLRAD